MLTPREKSPLPEAQRRVEPATLHHSGQRAQHTSTEVFWTLLSNQEAIPVEGNIGVTPTNRTEYMLAVLSDAIFNGDQKPLGFDRVA